MDSKPSNPKDNVGSRKPPISTIPAPVLFELGNALFEGHLKYGGHNWRAIGVRAGVYYDACFRHIAAWWSGEDTDPDSGMSHITKAIAGLVVLRDAMLNGMMHDDRPPRSPEGWMVRAKEQTAQILSRYEAVAKPAFTEANRTDWDPNHEPHLFDEPKDEGRAFETDEFCKLAIPDMHPYFEDEAPTPRSGPFNEQRKGERRDFGRRQAYTPPDRRRYHDGGNGYSPPFDRRCKDPFNNCRSHAEPHEYWPGPQADDREANLEHRKDFLSNDQS